MYHLLPDNVSDLLGKAIKRSELFGFTKPAALVLAFATVFFAPFPVFCAAALIATIGDAAASICGLGLGRVHFPKGSPKTIIGYVAGTVASFGVCLVSFLIFAPGLLPSKTVIISLSGALVFLVIDLLNLDLDDNMLNPIISAIVMSLLYFLI
jgi:dolichol kinase